MKERRHEMAKKVAGEKWVENEPRPLSWNQLKHALEIETTPACI